METLHFTGSHGTLTACATSGHIIHADACDCADCAEFGGYGSIALVDVHGCDPAAIEHGGGDILSAALIYRDGGYVEACARVEVGEFSILEDLPRLPAPLGLSSFQPGARVVIEHPTYGRDYGTYHGETERPELLSISIDGRYYNPQRVPASIVREPLAARDMVIGDLLNLAMLKEAIEKPFLGTLWTHGDSGMLTPYVCECSFGDGLKLATISTINQRPNYHVVRVDSSWQDSNWADGETLGEHIDEILNAIVDECGDRRWRDDEGEDADWDDEGASRDPWPAIDDEGGCSWGHIRWDWLRSELKF